MRKAIIRARYFVLLLLSLITGCSGTDYAVSGGLSDAKSIAKEINPVIKPFLIALATLAIGYNSIVIILGPASGSSGEDAIALAKRRLIIVVSALVAYGLLFYLFGTDIK